eukprot:771751-Rhodomonas_salina.1
MSWGGGGPKEELALAHLGFLFKGYRVGAFPGGVSCQRAMSGPDTPHAAPGVWYWEVVELMRKVRQPLPFCLPVHARQ